MKRRIAGVSVRRRLERARSLARGANRERHQRIVVGLALAGLVLPGCSKPEPASPMAAQMREIDKTWIKFGEVLGEKGAYHSQPLVTQVAGMFASDTITGSELYQSIPGFKKANDDIIEALKKLDSELGQGAMFDVAGSRSDVESLCKNCHGQFWDKTKARRAGR